MITTEKPFSNNCDATSLFEKGFFHDTATYIHPTSLIGAQVTLGEGVKIGPHCIILGNVTIGNGTRLYSNITIGFPAQDTGTTVPQGTITIGEQCHIREFVTIHSSKFEHGKTVIGNNCYIMNYAHVAHDVVLEDNVILINNVNIGGHAHIGKNVMLMANSAVHQFCKIGAYSALAPFSATRQDLPPFCLFNGQPAGFAGLNAVGLRRARFPQESIRNLKLATRLFYQQKQLLSTIETLLETTEKNDEYVKIFLAFIQTSSRGVSRRLMPSSSERKKISLGDV